MLCLKKKLRKLLEELLDQKLLERLGGESKNEKLYITGNLFAKGCTFSGPVNFGGGAAQAQPVSYSDEQVAQALANIVGRGKAIDAKKKWAGAIWLLQWVCSYPSNTKQACERIRSLPLPFITDDPLLWINIVSAMAHQENGQTAGTMNDVILGYVMAFENEVK